MGVENLDKIFNPRRIAVIGASNRENSLGAKLLRNMIGVGYNGVVYPVNPFRPTVQGITAYPNIKKIPRQVELAIIATPAHTVPQIIEECGASGVSAAIIVSAGFKEAGEEGKALEKEILEHKNRYNMRIIGPNSLGVMRPRIKLNATFTKKTASPGKIAFISQSAALCASVLDWASEAHVGFSALVSVGSMLDVDFGDLIDYFGTDIQTSSIVLYLESIKNARKFLSAARGFARAKPIVVVKAGRFRESAKAALSHTGALCGEDAVYDAAFRRSGVVRVEAINDLFNCAESLAMQPNPKGSNLTIITNAGGPGIMATDFLIAKGGELSTLSSETIRSLKSALPSYCSILNPIDILEEATVDRFKKVIEICFKDPNSNGFLIIYTPQGVADPVETAKMIVELSRKNRRTTLTSFMGEDDCWKARRILRKNGIPAFTTPEQAVSTFMYMHSYAENLELLYETPEEFSVGLPDPTSLKEVLRMAFGKGQEVLNPIESLHFLKTYSIPTIKTLVARDTKEAVAAASRLGYPVALKVLSPQITHKSKAEGVVLNVWSPEQVKASFRNLAERVEKCRPEAEFEGVIIQPMIQKKKCEILIGSKKDPHFGSVMVFGAGGSAAELLKDTSIGFPPLNQVLARRLMEKTAIFKILESMEHSVSAKLEEILVKSSQLVIHFPEIKEMDINPVIANERDAVAVDARIVIDKERIAQKTPPDEHIVIAPYPNKYITRRKLNDGTSVVLRPIKPEDEALLSELFQSLSEETMRFRFFQVIKDLPHESLVRYCNVDYDREIAIVAEMKKGKRKIIGATRLILEPSQKCGEFAVVVGDHWQRLGLGSKLVDYIIEIGKDMGLETIAGDVLSRNFKMIRLCTKKGFKLEPVDEDTIKAALKLS
ncbi:MAG: bifunctional acetate--CoA ligase family protein/GNAT family N-acetyltransferase [Candidatus Bathyarchaeota archaeon]|jgi:acetyltransferase|nr:bifunctional acetate--CoA ligase family protein/GNAT family N-acetyltransferase [Candidatus Bathyarchaeota archaeon]